MAKSKQTAVNSAVQSIIGVGKPKAKKDKNNPLGVYLELDEKALLDQVAAELGFSRHAVLQYAVRQFLASWKRGDKPEVTTQEVKILKAK